MGANRGKSKRKQVGAGSGLADERGASNNNNKQLD